MNDRPTPLRSIAPALALALAFGACAVEPDAAPEDIPSGLAAGTITRSFQDGVYPSATYTGTRDTTLAQSAANTTHGSATSARIDGDDPTGTGDDDEALVQFDVSSIPAGSTVEAATLSIDVTNASAGPYDVYALLRAWSESTATWNVATSGVPWAVPGAKGSSDRSSTVLASVSASANGRLSISLDASGIARVQSWVNQPSSNHGLVVAGPTINDGLFFATRESSTASMRPRLTVSYLPPSTADASSDAADRAETTNSDAPSTADTHVADVIDAIALTDASDASATDAATIHLPIEVTGPAGTIESVSFALTDATGITALALTGHRIGYENGLSTRSGQAKASVRVNGGAWIGITNATATDAEPELRYGGIGGGFHTVRFTLAASGFVTGTNRVDFRFEGSDGVTSGFRVLALNVLRAGAPVLPASAFVEDDPALRDPVDPSYASSGQTLWFRENSLVDPGRGVTIRASCSDCHARDGRDLHYFHYSNASIIQRSVFHGLSTEQGTWIAAYIRSLTTPAPASARPWNPPYQPGPGLDSRPAEAWAAGAGLGAVLASDRDMLPYLEPADGNWDEVTSTAATLILREMPIAVQLPDWNDWLPAVHPMDIWGTTFDSSSADTAYTHLRATLPTLVASPTSALIDDVGAFDRGVRQFIGLGRTDTTGQGPWRTLSGTTISEIPSWITREHAKLALSKWMGTKTWELMQEFGLETLPMTLLPPQNGVIRGEARGWPTDGQSVWANAPHMTADNKSYFVGQSQTVGVYQSSIWYQLQMTLNPAMRLATDTTPVDWAYHFRHMFLLASDSGEPQVLRYVESMIKAYQARDNGVGPDIMGYQLRFLHPWQFQSDSTGDTSFFDVLNTYRAGLRNDIVGSQLRAFLGLVETRPEFSLSTWPRRAPSTYDNTTHTYWFALESASYVPTAYSGTGDVYTQPNYNHADAFYRLIPRLRAQGIASTTIQSLVAWCERAWPNGAWSTL